MPGVIEPPQFGKVHTVEVYYEGKLSSQKKELEIQKATSKRSFLSDIIDLTAEAVNGDCKEMVLRINSDRAGVKLITVNKALRHERGVRFQKDTDVV